MAKETAWIIGSDAVVEWYTDMADPEAPYYSVWQGRDLRFTYDGDSVADGAEMLAQNLKMVEAMRNSDVLKIRLHKNREKAISDRSPYNASINFRCVDAEDDRFAVYNLNQGGAMKAIGDLRAELKAMKDQDSPKGIMGYIAPMLENEQVQQIIASTFMGFVGKILGGGAAPGSPGPPVIRPAAMAGIEDDTDAGGRLEQSLERLAKADPEIVDNLGRLADLSEKNPELFKAMLGHLKSM